MDYIKIASFRTEDIEADRSNFKMNLMGHNTHLGHLAFTEVRLVYVIDNTLEKQVIGLSNMTLYGGHDKEPSLAVHWSKLVTLLEELVACRHE